MAMDKILAILTRNRLAVIATNNSIVVGGSPESALVAYCADSRGRIYFQSMAGTRKSINIAANSNISFAIGLDMSKKILQYEGRAEQLTDRKDVEFVKALFAAWDSPTRPEHFKPNTLVYRVAPTWIGYSDYTIAPPDVWDWRPTE